MVSVLPVRTSRLTEVICVGQGGFANKVSLAGTCWALDRRTGSPRMEEGQLGGRLLLPPALRKLKPAGLSVCLRPVWDIQ